MYVCVSLDILPLTDIDALIGSHVETQDAAVHLLHLLLVCLSVTGLKNATNRFSRSPVKGMGANIYIDIF